MTEVGDDALRRRLRALPVFEGELPSFDSEEAPAHPAELFLGWLLEAIAAGVPEPHAMTLSTVDAHGRPSSRVLILKGLGDGRWEFATSRDSRKGRELAAAPWAAANFYWSKVGRQVRLRRDFLSRPQASRAESLVGHQSEVLRDRADLDAALDEARRRVADDPELVPEHWTAYHLVADEVEFWQADRARRHVRLRYQLSAQRWTRQLLWP